MEKPFVSVIIPAYNAEKYIKDTLESVLQQTWRELEIIVINDGSTDDTEAAILALSKDPRIKYIPQTNQGCSGAKNTGLQAATGSYIQYLDADDILSLDKIESQVQALLDHPLGLAVCRTQVFCDRIGDRGNEEIDTGFLFSSKNSLEFALNLYGIHGQNGMIQPNAFLMPRDLVDVVGVWDESISPSPDEDGEYFCRAILKATEIIFTPGPINYYRKQASSTKSLSKQISYRHAKGALGSLVLQKSHLLEAEDSSRVRQLMSTHFASYMYLYYSLYPDLSLLAEREIYALGVTDLPIVGGARFKNLAALIGFKNALKAKSKLNSVLKWVQKN